MPEVRMKLMVIVIDMNEKECHNEAFIIIEEVWL